jgi:hypothetical protein
MENEIQTCDKHGNVYTIPTDKDTVMIDGIEYKIIRVDISEPVIIDDNIVGFGQVKTIFLGNGNILIETHEHIQSASKKLFSFKSWLKNLLSKND